MPGFLGFVCKNNVLIFIYHFCLCFGYLKIAKDESILAIVGWDFVRHVVLPVPLSDQVEGIEGLLQTKSPCFYQTLGNRLIVIEF